MIRLNLIIGSLPVTLTNGTTADATQVMSDLNFIVNQVNANAAPLANAALTNANNNFTTVQSGQAATQAANFPIASQIQNNSLQNLSSVLGTNTLTARISALPLGGYVLGQMFTFIPSNANTGATTLNVDGNGARSILSMGSALSGAELQTYKPAIVGFDGAAFDLLNGTPYVKGPNIPAAATLNLDGNFGDYNQVDGIATITAMTLSPGRHKWLEFTSSPRITNSGTLVLGSNTTPSPGDVFSFRGESGGIVRLASRLLSGSGYLQNILSGNVALNNAANFFDGPSVAQPNTGVWLAVGSITLLDAGATSDSLAKLWDGNTVAASGAVHIATLGVGYSICLAGIFVSPQGNIRMSAKSPSTTATIQFNATGSGADSQVTVVRIA